MFWIEITLVECAAIAQRTGICLVLWCIQYRENPWSISCRQGKLPCIIRDGSFCHHITWSSAFQCWLQQQQLFVVRRCWSGPVNRLPVRNLTARAFSYTRDSKTEDCFTAWVGHLYLLPQNTARLIMSICCCFFFRDYGSSKRKSGKNINFYYFLSCCMKHFAY